MPLLHFRVTKKDQSINMPRTIHAQNLTFRRAIVTRNKSNINNLPTTVGKTTPEFQAEMANLQKAYDQDLKGGVLLDCSFLRGFEIMSNFSSNDIMIPFHNEDTNIDIKFELDIASEDIALSFNVKTFDYERGDTVLFAGDSETGAGVIQHIDLIFHYDALYNYDTY